METILGAKRIDVIKPGDMIWSWDAGSQRRTLCCVLAVDRYHDCDIHAITIEGDSALLRATRHHSFLTPRGWAKCADLRPGDCLIRIATDGKMSCALLFQSSIPVNKRRCTICERLGLIRSFVVAL